MILVPRPEELDGSNEKESLTKTIVEGQTEFQSDFIKSLETEIILDRKFMIPGYTYNLTLISFNLHDINSPNIIMKWHILCANPVLPQHWNLDYKKNIYSGTYTFGSGKLHFLLRGNF